MTTQLLIAGFHGPDPGHHDDVVSRDHFRLIQPVNLPDTPSHPVADHGAAQLRADGDPQAAQPPAVPLAIDHQLRRHRRLPLAVDPAEFVVLFYRDGRIHKNKHLLRRCGG